MRAARTGLPVRAVTYSRFLPKSKLAVAFIVDGAILGPALWVIHSGLYSREYPIDADPRGFYFGAVALAICFIYFVICYLSMDASIGLKVLSGRISQPPSGLRLFSLIVRATYFSVIFVGIFMVIAGAHSVLAYLPCGIYAVDVLIPAIFRVPAFHDQLLLSLPVQAT